SNFGSDSVAVYSIDNGKRAGSVNVGSHPEMFTLSPNQFLLLVINTGSADLSVISLIDNKGRALFPRPSPQQTMIPLGPETMIPLGKDPRAIAVKAFVSQR